MWDVSREQVRPAERDSFPSVAGRSPEVDYSLIDCAPQFARTFLTSGKQSESTLVTVERATARDPRFPPAQRFQLTQTVDGARFSLKYEFSHRLVGEELQLVLCGTLDVIDAVHLNRRQCLLSFCGHAKCDDGAASRELSMLTQAVHESFIDGGAPALYRALRQHSAHPRAALIFHVFHAMHAVMELEIEQEESGSHGVQPQYFQAERQSLDDECAGPGRPAKHLEEAYASAELLAKMCGEEYVQFAFQRDPDLANAKFYFLEDYADACTPCITLRPILLSPALEGVVRTRDDKDFNDFRVVFRLKQVRQAGHDGQVRLEQLKIAGPRRGLFRKSFEVENPHAISVAFDRMDDDFFRAVFRALHESNCEQPGISDIRESLLYEQLLELGCTLKPCTMVSQARELKGYLRDVMRGLFRRRR